MTIMLEPMVTRRKRTRRTAKVWSDSQLSAAAAAASATASAATPAAAAAALLDTPPACEASKPIYHLGFQGGLNQLP